MSDLFNVHATQKERRDLAYAIRNALHGVMPLLF